MDGLGVANGSKEKAVTGERHEPSPATLFIAELVQMSIIYADTCKVCCHINNCIAKTVTWKKKKSAQRSQTWAALNVERLPRE